MSKAKKNLKLYRKSRNFGATPEPKGKKKGRKPDERFFVVQEHNASNHHYDFRFYHKKTLKSWAIPKGPSLKPSEKRLAIKTEDHPVEYADFEGTIPAGHYGAGEIIVWDRGRIHFDKKIKKGLSKGSLSFHLDGQKLRGSFELVQLEDDDDPEREKWLLIKKTDDHAKTDGRRKSVTNEKPASVVSGKTMDDIRSTPEIDPESCLETFSGSRRAGMPQKPSPMLPTLVEEVPSGKDWIHERKWDGIRLLAEKRGKKVSLRTRNRKDWADRFPAIAEEIGKLCDHDFVIDGEVIVLGDEEDGISDFQRLLGWLNDKSAGDLQYYAFDVLHLCKHDLRNITLSDRKNILTHWFHEKREVRDLVQLGGHSTAKAEICLEEARANGWEGIISKRAESVYTEGRSRDWFKIRCVNTQDFLIVGSTPPKGRRKGFGSLLLAAHTPEGDLRYVCRVGSGFDRESLKSISAKLKRIARKTSPLTIPTDDLPKNVSWTTPALIAQVAFTKKTDGQKLLHPSFLGLREDKDTAEVLVESPAAEG